MAIPVEYCAAALSVEMEELIRVRSEVFWVVMTVPKRTMKAVKGEKR